MSLRATIKNAVAGFVPPAIRKQILRRYYLARVKGYQRASAWESQDPDLQVVSHIVAAGDSVVDVGANFGYYTVYLAGLVGRTGSVTSFEPIPRTFDVLDYSVRKLSLRNVTTFNYAISDQARSATMKVPQFEHGSDNYYQASLVRPEANEQGKTDRQIAVNVQTLDSVLLPRSRKLTFIKMDVEGHELPAIRGARGLIEAFKPALLIEVSGDLDDARSASSMLVSQLRSDGYEAYWYDGAKLRRRARGDSSLNYFFLTDDHVRALAPKVGCDVG